MNQYLKIDPWCIIEEGFNENNHKSSESIFSIGNGRTGQRANFEEEYSGPSLQGSYIAGVYYPDKTKVGWWKNGYPEYFAKVLNSPNWIGINIQIGNEKLDLAKCKVKEFSRVLNLKEGTLSRKFIAEFPSGKQVEVNSIRFLSMASPEIGALKYSLKAINFSGEIKFSAYLDGDVRNQDANWDEMFWEPVSLEIKFNEGYITTRTKKTDFDVCIGMNVETYIDGNFINKKPKNISKNLFVSAEYSTHPNQGQTLEIYKYAAILSSMYHDKKALVSDAKKVIKKAVNKGFEKLLEDHRQKWEKIWEHSDIIIEGDDPAQQSIRFNIFHLNQTYTGEDERLNIGPKGFTGEKYGGSTYWDTEAYCLPFFLCTAPQSVSRNLLLYRYKHLDKAIQNGKKLGFKNGAAMYPMVTMNGEECHNEWEITFEEIHRNGAIAFAIYNYLKHTGDIEYLIDYGLEVLIAISRFWCQRVNYSEHKSKYVILGVTGPNEYENNINNNWYTNKIATWTLKYTLDAINYLKSSYREKFKSLCERISLDVNKETKKWNHIIDNMYFPTIEKKGLFLQQEGYLDKELLTIKDLSPSDQPLNQKWSWDRILRSCFIKQADTLQGIYLFEEEYDTETIRKHFDFYEPRTVHESSLSSCIHSILAAKIGKIDKAYELYLRTSRLDLDDYNNEVNEGLHITSMAGTWMSVVEGFGGKRIKDGKLYFDPKIPKIWKSFSFKINYRNSLLKISATANEIIVQNESKADIEVDIKGKVINLLKNSTQTIKINNIN